MSTRPSIFLLIQIRAKGKVGFTIPLSLAVIADLVDSLSDLAALARLFVPKRIKPFVAEPVRFIRCCLHELRKYGRWQLVDIDAEDVQVSVKFY